MPTPSGIEVAAGAQRLERPPGVIILSVHGDESYIMRALVAGARANLLKSATDEDLILSAKRIRDSAQMVAKETTMVISSKRVTCNRRPPLTSQFHSLMLSAGNDTA